MSPTHKTCSKCGELKDIEEFYKIKPRWNTDRAADCKSCVSLERKAYYQANKDKVKAREASRRSQSGWTERCRTYHKNNWAKKLRHSAVRSSKAKGFTPPTITEEWILSQPLVCPYLGVALSLDGLGDKAPWSPSLDRINNSKGYTPDNVRVTSWVWNLMRGPLTLEEALRVVDVIRGVAFVKAA